MSEYRTRANTYTCPEDGCRGCEGCYGEDDTADCTCCDYVFEGPTGFAEHDTWYCQSCDIRACAGCVGEDDPSCDGCGLVFEHTSGPFDDDGNYIGKAESLMAINQNTPISNFTTNELTHSSTVQGDFNQASINSSGHQNLEVRGAESRDELIETLIGIRQKLARQEGIEDWENDSEGPLDSLSSAFIQELIWYLDGDRDTWDAESFGAEDMDEYGKEGEGYYKSIEKTMTVKRLSAITEMMMEDGKGDYSIIVAYHRNGDTVVSDIKSWSENGLNLQLNEENFYDFVGGAESFEADFTVAMDTTSEAGFRISEPQIEEWNMTDDELKEYALNEVRAGHGPDYWIEGDGDEDSIRITEMTREHSYDPDKFKAESFGADVKMDDREQWVNSISWRGPLETKLEDGFYYPHCDYCGDSTGDQDMPIYTANNQGHFCINCLQEWGLENAESFSAEDWEYHVYVSDSPTDDIFIVHNARDFGTQEAAIKAAHEVSKDKRGKGKMVYVVAEEREMEYIGTYIEEVIYRIDEDGDVLGAESFGAESFGAESQVRRAIDFLEGAKEEMTSDKKYYTEKLIEYAKTNKKPKELDRAIWFLDGAKEEMTFDKKYYTDVLILNAKQPLDYSEWVCPFVDEIDFGSGLEKDDWNDLLSECGCTDYRIVKDSASPSGETVECSCCKRDISYVVEPYREAKDVYEEKERKWIKQMARLQYDAETFEAEDDDMERYMNRAWKKYTPRQKMDMQLRDLHYGHTNKNTKRYFKKGYEYGWKLAREKAANGAPLYKGARAKDLITTSLRKDGFLVDAGAYAGFDDSWRVYEGELNAESFSAEYGKRQRFGNRYVGRDTKGKFISNVSVGRSLKADRRNKSKTPARSGFGHRGDIQKGGATGFTLPSDTKRMIGMGAVLGGILAYWQSKA